MKNYTEMHVDKVEKLPPTKHYAILRNITVPNGYGGSYNEIAYTAFTDKTEWEAEIKALSAHTGFRAIVVTPAAVEIRIQINESPQDA